MRIAFLNYWFSEGMGYSENMLPSAMARLGHQVHLVTSDVQVYFDSPSYDRTYRPFLGPPVVPCGMRSVDGVTIHRLPFRSFCGLRGVRGLIPLLRQLQLNVVQCFEARDLLAVEAALARPALGYRLFLESHIHRSVFGPASRLGALVRVVYARTVGRFVAMRSEHCYAISTDAAEIAQTHLGIPAHKLSVSSLGVDTSMFRPCQDTQARTERRRALGIAPEDIVCVYTGRLSNDKNPLLLAKAVALLRAQHRPFRTLFVGDGDQAEALRAMDGVVVHPFVPSRELAPLYWASDIGVWPRQESTSQLDAAACGLPVIIGDRANVFERIVGNGAFYREDSVDDLARVIATLAEPSVRNRMGAHGARKMRELYSWDSIARERAGDYERSLLAPARRGDTLGTEGRNR